MIPCYCKTLLVPTQNGRLWKGVCIVHILPLQQRTSPSRVEIAQNLTRECCRSCLSLWPAQHQQLRKLDKAAPVSWISQRIFSEVKSIFWCYFNLTNGPAEGQCDFFCLNSGLNFGTLILGGEFLEGEFSGGPLLLEKQDAKIQPKNLGVKNMLLRIRPQIRVLEVHNLLCRNLSPLLLQP